MINKGGEVPSLGTLRRDVDQVMSAYQGSRYSQMLRRVPELLTQTQVAVSEYSGDDRRAAQRILAFASQSAAMILAKRRRWAMAVRDALRALTRLDDRLLGRWLDRRPPLRLAIAFTVLAIIAILLTVLTGRATP